ncbi:MAG: TetR/AcrR family transcriptional regulator [Eubacteriales bacterium]
MKTNKAIETHNAIVNAAETLFLEKSVKRVTVNEITKKAGVAKGTFYLYFESKDDVVWHFMEHRLDSILHTLHKIDLHGYAEADIDAIIDNIIKYVKKHEKVLKMIHQARFYSFLGKKNMEKKYIYSVVEPIYQWMEKGIATGLLDIENPQFVAYFITLSVHDMIDSILDGDTPYTIDEFGENIKALLVKLLIKR